MKKFNQSLLSILLFVGVLSCSGNDDPAPVTPPSSTSTQTDTTLTTTTTHENQSVSFLNPVIAADYPDPDVVRIGDTYYFVSTTMHHFPGATILKSHDLVNWEYCAQPLAQLAYNDNYNLTNGQNAYAKGMWAAAMTAHDGKLYLLINGNDAGGFLLTTDNPEGEWQMRKLDRIYYDPGMLFDNGKVYIACGIANIRICELDEDFNFIQEKTVITDKEGLEGSHLYKIGNYYYIYATYGGWPSGQVVFRSDDIFGEYKERVLVEKYINGQPNTVHQGALIETPDGDWWTMLMEDKGAIGRMPSLHPVKWSSGWPIVADNGVPQLKYNCPHASTTSANAALPTSDDFSSTTLGMQWQWNHNADDTKWSLDERAGWLRLKTASTITDGNIMYVRNMLTQRIFAKYDEQGGLVSTQRTIGTTCIDFSGLNDGNVAGIAITQDPYAAVYIQNNNGTMQVCWTQGVLSPTDASQTQSIAVQPVFSGTTVYLRAMFDAANGVASFAYSTDNAIWQTIGSTTTMSYNLSVFVGARFGIFSYATKNEDGYADFDYFETL